MRRRGVRQFVKFGIVGTSGFLVNLIVFTALQQFLLHSVAERQHWYYVLFSVGFLAGGVSNYALNRVWTFRSSGHPAREGAQFLSVSVVALCVGLIVSYLGAPVLGRGHALWFVSTLSGMFVNFFINKYWTFRSVL
ncbi:MAG: GtrA family protein [Candidatus Eremiobacteraeota bacterium]|nr:GtrA family protein [Candidatus Eremiobacteraeota bacterium]